MASTAPSDLSRLALRLLQGCGGRAFDRPAARQIAEAFKKVLGTPAVVPTTRELLALATKLTPESPNAAATLFFVALMAREDHERIAARAGDRASDQARRSAAKLQVMQTALGPGVAAPSGPAVRAGPLLRSSLAQLAAEEGEDGEDET